MRVLLAGPSYERSSLSPYVRSLAENLARQGASVSTISSDSLPYDQTEGRFWPSERIVRSAQALLECVDLEDYDVISLQFGNLEIEQLLPSCWRGRPRPPAIYHVHSTDWTLFAEHVPHRGLLDAVRRGVREMDAYVYFGSFAATACNVLLAGTPSRVILYPTTVSAEAEPAPFTELSSCLDLAAGRRPLATLFGFASPWKDVRLLVQALSLVSSPLCFLLAGPYWSTARSSGLNFDGARRELEARGISFRVVDTYLGHGERKALLQASDFGVFPYQDHYSFQGSGALAEYLGAKVPVIATDVANLREMVGGAGLVVPAGDPHSLAKAITHLAGEVAYRQGLRSVAETRAPLFAPSRHAADCLTFYRSLVTRRP